MCVSKAVHITVQAKKHQIKQVILIILIYQNRMRIALQIWFLVASPSYGVLNSATLSQSILIGIMAS